MELRFDVRGNNFADIKVRADQVLRDFIGRELLTEVARHYTDLEGTSIDVSSPSTYRRANTGFHTTVRSVIEPCR